MKFLFCQDCGDFVKPGNSLPQEQWCYCGRHAVYWEDPALGKLAVYDKYRCLQPPTGVDGVRFYTSPRCYVMGVCNSLFLDARQSLSKEMYREIALNTGPHYKFHHVESCVVRIRVGETGDTRYVSERS